MIKVYCDGGCRGNQFDENIGGWGYRYEHNDITVENCGGTINTTNNKMELLSCIKALEDLVQYNQTPIEVIMDSQYVVMGMNQWVHNWIKNGWRTARKKSVENQDLWQKLLKLSKRFDKISFVKCKGHSDDVGNNHADRLANKGMDVVEK